MSLRPLHPDLAELAKTKLKEDPEKLRNALEEIKQWLNEQPHLHANTGDQWLTAYIRGCKFDLEKVKKKLDLFYTCRGTAPEFYKFHPKDDKFRQLFARGFYLPLPKLKDPAAPRVTLIQTGLFDLSQENVTDAYSVVEIIEKIMLLDDDNCVVAGNITIIDLKNTDITHLLKPTTTQLRKIIACQQNSVPFRSNNTICINFSNGFDIIFNIMNPLLNEKNRQEFQSYGEDFDDMYTNFVPKEIMPKEYGGNGGTLQEIIDTWMAKIEQYSDWLEDDRQYRADESKRPGQPRTAEDMFGTDSSFDLFSCLSIFKGLNLNNNE